jgi:very-short-patch-repair endonuclease
MEENVSHAQELRRNPTEAELLLWAELRGQLLGAKFRRQVPIGSYIVDFACLRRRLVIELDGGQHLESAADAERDRWLRAKGFLVLRFWNHDVLRNLRGVLETISGHLGTTEGTALSRKAAPPS